MLVTPGAAGVDSGRSRLDARLLCFIPLLDITTFSKPATPQDSNDNPVAVNSQPLLWRIIVVLFLIILVNLAILQSWSHKRNSSSSSTSPSIRYLLRIGLLSLQSCFLCVLLGSDLFSCCLETLVFSLSVSCLMSDPTDQLSRSLSFPSFAVDSVPLLLSWLSSYLLVLDHEGVWQLWPLAALVVLYLSYLIFKGAEVASLVRRGEEEELLK